MAQRPGSAGSGNGVLEACAPAVSGNGTACASCSSVPQLSLQPCLSFPGLVVCDMGVQHRGFQGRHQKVIYPQGVCSQGRGPCNIHKLFALK